MFVDTCFWVVVVKNGSCLLDHDSKICYMYIYRLVTNYQSHIYCTTYVMPNGDVRQSHSANFFKVTGRVKEDINQRPERLREESNPSPEIFTETPSAATLVEESNTVNPKLLSPETHNQKSSNYLTV